MATVELSMGLPPQAMKYLWIAIGLLVVTGVLLVISEVRGNSKKPPLTKKQHASEMAHMINCELEDLYSNPKLREKIVAKLKPGGYREPGQTHKLAHGRLAPSDVSVLPEWRMQIFYVSKWDLNSAEDVVAGNFGRLKLNERFFCARTIHHHYALGLAAQLFYLQIYAFSGRDPRKVQRKERHIENACETVLTLAGKFNEYSATREHEIASLVKTERKVNREVGELLHITEKEAIEVEEEMQKHSRNITDWVKFKWHVTEKADEKIACLLNKEKRHLEKLIARAERKRNNIARIIKAGGLDQRKNLKLQSTIHQIDSEIIKFGLIIESLDHLIQNRHNWEIKHRLWHNWLRDRKTKTTEIADMIHEENEKIPIDMQMVHALLTSLTAAKAELISIIETEEEEL
jgi:hypothetical protein